MADKTPVRVVFNSDNVATGMAEFQSGETVGVVNGGTGLSSLGSSLQVLRVNAAGNALEFGTLEDLGDIGSIGSTLTAPSNADFTITTAGTGNIILNDLSIIDNTLTTNRSNDDLKINASGSGTVVLENLKVGTSGATVTTILDEDAMGSDSATALATQQSIKAYVDNEVGNVSTTSISQGDSNVTVADSGTGNITIEVDGTDRITTVAATTTTATGHSLVIGAASNSAGGQIKFLEGTDNGTNGVTVQGPSSTADVTVTLPSSAGTLALTSDITFTASSTDTLTNKTFDVEGTGNSISNIDVADLKSGVLDTDLSSVSGSDDTLASAKAIKSYVDSQLTASDLDFSTDDSTALSISLSTESLQFSGGSGISTRGSANTVTIDIDTGTVVTKTDTQTLTNKTLTSAILNTGVSGTAVLDEDNFASNSATQIATQQSIKAYVDSQDANIASDTLTLTNKTFDVEGTGNSISNIDVADLKSGVLDTDLSSVSGSDDTLASAKAIKSYVDSQVTAQDLDFATDDSTALNIDLDSETLQFSGGNGINTRGSNNTVTIDIDTGTVVTLTDSQTLTNKVLTNPTINAFSGIGNGSITGNLSIAGAVTATSVTTNDIVSNGSNADINLTPAGTGTVAITTDATVGDDLSLISDAAVLNFGSDSEIKLTHVHDTGLLLTDSGGTPTLQLHDANESIASDGSKIIITSGGTTFNLPTADGSSGQALVTDGAGTLSFDTVSSSVSDDGLAIVANNRSIGTSAKVIDSFAEAVTDGVYYFAVANDETNDRVSSMNFTVCHNNTGPFVGGIRGGGTHTSNNMPTVSADSSNDVVRVKMAGPSADTKISMYRIPLSTANTSDATRGNTVTTSNTDVDSASESIDTFAHATYRAAKYFILIDNDSKTETQTVEALVVHDGTNAFITTYGDTFSGSNQLATLTAAISGDNVVLSAAGFEPNLNFTIHKILLSDNMTAASNSNQKVFGATTISSSSTALDTFDIDSVNGAVYYIVGKNASEGAYSVQEIYASASYTIASVAQGPFVSTKDTTQLEFTSTFSTTAHNTYQLSATSTSGGSTVVNGYRINCRAG